MTQRLSSMGRPRPTVESVASDDQLVRGTLNLGDQQAQTPLLNGIMSTKLNSPTCCKTQVPGNIFDLVHRFKSVSEVERVLIDALNLDRSTFSDQVPITPIPVPSVSPAQLSYVDDDEVSSGASLVNPGTSVDACAFDGKVVYNANGRDYAGDSDEGGLPVGADGDEQNDIDALSWCRLSGPPPLKVSVQGATFYLHRRMWDKFFPQHPAKTSDQEMEFCDIGVANFATLLEYFYSNSLKQLERLNADDLDDIEWFANRYGSMALLAAVFQARKEPILDDDRLPEVERIYQGGGHCYGFREYFRKVLQARLLGPREDDYTTLEVALVVADSVRKSPEAMTDVIKTLHDFWTGTGVEKPNKMMEECKWVDNDEQGTGYDTDWPEDNANGGWDETGRDSNNNVDQGIGKAAEPANADFWEIQENCVAGINQLNNPVAAALSSAFGLPPHVPDHLITGDMPVVPVPTPTLFPTSPNVPFSNPVAFDHGDDWPAAPPPPPVDSFCDQNASIPQPEKKIPILENTSALARCVSHWMTIEIGIGHDRTAAELARDLGCTEDEAESALEELVRIGKLKLGIMDDGNAYYWAEVGWAEDPDAGARKPSVFDKEAALQKTSPIARCVYHFTQEMKLFYCGGTVSHGDIVPKLGCTHVEAQIALDELEQAGILGMAGCIFGVQTYRDVTFGNDSW